MRRHPLPAPDAATGPRPHRARPVVGVALSCALAAWATAGCSLLPAATEPDVQRLVAEDDQVRVDELRVRGQTQRLSVQPKSGAAAYDIVPAKTPGAASGQGAAGQRVWPVLSF